MACRNYNMFHHQWYSWPRQSDVYAKHTTRKVTGKTPLLACQYRNHEAWTALLPSRKALAPTSSRCSSVQAIKYVYPAWRDLGHAHTQVDNTLPLLDSSHKTRHRSLLVAGQELSFLQQVPDVWPFKDTCNEKMPPSSLTISYPYISHA